MEVTKILNYTGGTPTARLFVNDGGLEWPPDYYVIPVSELGEFKLRIVWLRRTHEVYGRYYVVSGPSLSPDVMRFWTLMEAKKFIKTAI